MSRFFLTAHGTSTHSSMPRPDNAIFRLAKAMAKIADYDTKPELDGQHEAVLPDPGQDQRAANVDLFPQPGQQQRSRLWLQQADHEISKDVLLHAIMRNTIAPVFLNAGFRGNVIPGSAEATINFRTIPGTKAEELIAEMKKVIDDPEVDVGLPTGGESALFAKYMKLMAGMKESPTNTELYQTLAKTADAEWSAPVTPYLFQAGTDAFAWRSRGVPVYGVYPYPITDDDLSRMHGNDERVPVKSLQEGTNWIYRTLVAGRGEVVTETTRTLGYWPSAFVGRVSALTGQQTASTGG